MKFAWEALKPSFGALRIDQITPERCIAYRALRKRQGVGDGTILKELGFMRAAVRRTASGHLARFDMPAQPPPMDLWITQDEAAALIAATGDTHLRLFTILAITTAGRSGALLDLTWDRVDFERRQIALGERQEGRKARAVVPMNPTAEAALRAAQSISTSEYVIEYGGKKVASIKKGFRAAARQANLPGVTPHTLRHSAATWMAQRGIPMVEIARYLGHSNPAITYKVYAKHTPDYLRGAAAAVDFQGGVLSTTGRDTMNAKATKGLKPPAKKTTAIRKSKG